MTKPKILDLIGGDLSQLSSRVPHIAAIGAQYVALEPSKTTARLEYADNLVGNPLTGVIHGGVITSLLDTTSGLSVACTFDDPQSTATLDLRIDYFRPATAGKPIFAQSHCHKTTKRVAFVRGVAYHDTPDDPIAASVGTFMLAANATRMWTQDAVENAKQQQDAAKQAVNDALSAPSPLKPSNDPVDGVASSTPPGNPHPLSELVETIPYAKFLGVTALEQDGVLVLCLSFHRGLIGNPMLPAIHGGVIGGFLEMAALMQIIAENEKPDIPKPIDITIDYLRSGRPIDTFAKATITKLGRRIANVRVEAWQDDPSRPIATAHGQFLMATE